MIILQENNSWIIEMAGSAYCFGVTEAGQVVHSYWGERLPYAEDYPKLVEVKDADSFNMAENQRREEYPAVEGSRYFEPGIILQFSDGVRDLHLRFAGSEIDQENEHIQIRMIDPQYPICVNLHYQGHSKYDLLERWVEVENNGDKAIELSRVFSAVWQVPQLDDYWMSFYTGKWSDELQHHHERISGGKKVLDGRRITTGHDGNPWFGFDDGTASEEAGRVWFATLEWSGNWKTIAELTQNGFLQILSGINDWDFVWQLGAGERFETPCSIAGFSAGGFGSASRSMHDFIRAEKLPHGRMTRKVLYNSWEATTFDVDVDSQIELAKIAAEMGVELFVLDDGWFHRRNGDNAGLGDWWPDEEKFPDGLKPLIEAVNDLGMEFGLWIEPEMVNPDSDLFREHPEWVIQFNSRSMNTARGQCILNMGRQDVQDYLIRMLDDLLSSHNVGFVKWDMNRNPSEPGWDEAPGDPREIWVRYVFGLYRVWGELGRRHPEIVFQSCSGGGGRINMGVLAFADQFWVSDNTEATARLKIQEGFAQMFPAATMECWVTDQNESLIPLAFRFHASMCGVLGVGGNIGKWDVDQRNEAREWIAVYKEYRHIIHWGDRYVLRSALAGAMSAVLYIDKQKDNAVLFAFRTYQVEPTMLRQVYLCGLDAERRYEIAGQVMSGAAWEKRGIKILLENFESRMVIVKAVG